MTVYHIDPDIDKYLDVLAKNTKKSKSWLLREALDDYVRKHKKNIELSFSSKLKK